MADLSHIDLVALAVREGITLTRSGERWRGLCPFHEEKTPSFTIWGNRFHCYGCGTGGDAADFVGQLKGLSFKKSLSYLGIESGHLTAEQRQTARREAEARRRRQALVAAFRSWEVRHSSDLGGKIRAAYAWIRAHIQTPDDLCGNLGDVLQELYLQAHVWEAQLKTLAGDSDAEKFDLYQEATHDGN